MNCSRIVVVGLLAMALVGCSQEDPGTPVTEASSNTAGGDQIPTIREPLDASRYLDDPCQLTSEDFMRSLGYVEHETVTGETDGTAALSGPACPWRVADGIKGLQVIIQTGNQENGMGGLRGMYRAYKNGQYAFWDPDTVLGYPAAYTDLADRRDRGSCQIVVGIQDNLSFVAAAEGYRDDPEQACVDAKAVAEKVIQTLKGGA